jgi:hypothetical protein
MYKDHREPFRPPDIEEVFNMATKETPKTFYIGKLVDARYYLLLFLLLLWTAGVSALPQILLLLYIFYVVVDAMFFVSKPSQLNPHMKSDDE